MARVRDFLALCRFPAVFTAVADPIAGAALAGYGGPLPPGILAVSLVSGCIYLFGMVQNDLADVDEDRATGKPRPIPQGRVTVGEATTFARCLAGGGLAVAVAVDVFLIERFALPGQLTLATLALLGAIWLYNRVAKETFFGPLAMGLCRGLNVGLGVAFAAVGTQQVLQRPVPSLGISVATGMLGMTLYIAGVTAFASREEGVSDRGGLLRSWMLSLVGLSLLLIATLTVYRSYADIKAIGLFVMIAVAGSYRVAAAVRDPSPPTVGRTVGSLILLIIVIDAAVVVGATGDEMASLGLVLLSIPAIALRRIRIT